MSTPTALVARPNWTVHTPPEFRSLSGLGARSTDTSDFDGDGHDRPISAPERQTPRLVLDRTDESVWYGARKITLAPKAFSLLRYLAERRGRLVTKDELLDAVWPGVFVGDAVLKVAVREIRQALDDDAREPQFIQTAHRRGYRFIGDLDIVDGMGGRALRVIDGRGRPGAVTGRPVTPGLVGRGNALALLEERLALANSGARQVVFVTGEPGIGKTALVDAWVESLPASVIVARGQCLELAGPSEAYLPFLDAFGRLLRDPENAPLVALVRRNAPTWLQQMPALVDPSDRAALEAEVRGATRDRLLREMVDAIEALAADRPLVLVLEDLQWSDPSTVDLLSALARRRDKARVMVVGTYRPADLVLERHPLRTARQDLHASRSAVDLPLEFLSALDVSALVDARLRPHGLPDSFARLLHERTDGNPLFAVSVMDYLIDRGHLRQNSAGAWGLDAAIEEIATVVPDTLRLMVEKQIERLSADDQALLEAASVAGLEFPATAVAAALGADEESIEARCQALAERAHLLVSRGPGSLADQLVERFAFTHSIHQQVFYQRITSARRRRLHLAVGERGEQVYGARASEIAGELAVHFEQAREMPRAIAYLRKAGENATRRSANQEAIACLTRALALADLLERDAASLERLGLYEQLGLVLRSTGDVTVAAEQFIEMARLAAELGRTEDEARAWLYAASVLSWFNRDRCLRAAERAERLTIADPVLRAHVRGYAAYARLIFQGWRAEDAAACAEAARVTRAAGEKRLFGFHLGRLVHVHAMRSDYTASIETAADGLAHAGGAADPYDYLMCQFWRACSSLLAGRWGEMQQVLESTARLSERNGHRRLSILFTLVRGWLHEQAGDYARARSLCAAALADARESAYPFGQLIGLVLVGFAELGLGAYDRARASFEEIAARLDRERLLMDWIWRMPLAWGFVGLELAEGRDEVAAAHAHRLVQLAQACGERTWLALGHAALARVAIKQQRWKAADQQLARATALVADGDLPLAAWRVHALAADLHARRRREPAARAARAASNDVLAGLAASLDAGDPLRLTVEALAQPLPELVVRRAVRLG
jgi:DNA-binding winged helix-turn-helix (wHTH) protein/tetratricopeptide (TPR) repeat protein